MFPFRLRLLLAAALPCPALTCPALAQTPAAAPSEVQLEEIVVTADRQASFAADLVQVGTFRNARLIDVPLTVNVVPDEVLRAQAAQGLFDALRNTAGVSRSQLNGATYDNVAIRGILVENRTSYRLNGSLPVINLVDLPIENKARVEVLKGVGALYYGFAPPSGIVNLVSKRATETGAEGLVQADVHGGFGGYGDLSYKGERFGARVIGGLYAVETGIEEFGGSREVASVALDWAATERLSLRFDFEHVAKDVTETPAILLNPAVGGVVRLPRVPPNDRNLGDERFRYDAFADNWLLRADWRISGQFALTVEGGVAYTERDRDFAQFEAYDPVSGEGRLRLFETVGQNYRNGTVRGELAGAFRTGPVTHNLIVGASHTTREQNGRSNRITVIPQNLFRPRDVLDPAGPARETLTTAPTEVADNGIYALDRVTLFEERVQILGGVRWTDYRRRTRNTAGAVTQLFEVEEVTPTVGLIVKPRADVSIYGTWLQGLEESGVAPANTANAFEVLPPAISDQYELGVKAELGGVVVQAAGFQIERASAFTDPTDNLFKLAGRARYRGIEFSASGEPVPQVSVYASAQYLDAEVTRGLAALVGKVPENTPDWTGSLFAEWRPAERVALSAGGYYVGARAVNGLNQAFVSDYATLSLSARYSPPGLPVTLQVNADNVTNERYWSAVGNNLLGVGLPRQVRFTARAAF